jgi:hypothetical protein
MDINGAKELKKRVGQNEADDASRAPEPADVPADAPPVYHWTGKAPEADHEAEDEVPPQRASLFSRLGFSSR